MRLASRFGYAANQIRRDRPLTHEVRCTGNSGHYHLFFF